MINSLPISICRHGALRGVLRRTWRHLGQCAALVVFLPLSAVAQSTAQPREPSFFVDVAVLDAFCCDVGRQGEPPVGALGLGIGIRLSRNHSVRVEYQRPVARLYERHEDYFGPSFMHEVDRESSLSIMFARHIGAPGHPRVDILGGFTSLAISTTGYITSQYRSITGVLDDPFTLATDDHTATATLSGGLDAVFPLTRRIALVPQIRVHTIVLGTAIRAGVAMRFQF
jgi:hypothetical protein